MRTEELPRIFRPEAIDPTTSAFNAELAANRATTPKVYDVGAVRMREIRHRQWLAEGGPSPLATERTIALLKERRSALIAAAVTGQVDVGAAA